MCVDEIKLFYINGNGDIEETNLAYCTGSYPCNNSSSKDIYFRVDSKCNSKRH